MSREFTRGFSPASYPLYHSLVLPTNNLQYYAKTITFPVSLDHLLDPVSFLPHTFEQAFLHHSLPLTKRLS